MSDIQQFSDKFPAFLKDSSLKGTKIIISYNEEKREFTLDKILKPGMRGVPWKAYDRANRPYCIKFILAEYDINWTPEAEFLHATKLFSSKLFAKFEFYGTPTFDNLITSPKCELLAQVVEWIEGNTLSTVLTERSLSVTDFRLLSRQLCSALASLEKHDLAHDDLHSDNVMLEEHKNALTGDPILSIKIIDTGWLKKKKTRINLLSDLQTKLKHLEPHCNGQSIKEEYTRLKERYDWFEIDDQERIVRLFIEMYNHIYPYAYREKAPVRRFLETLSDSFNTMLDIDLNRRIRTAKDMADRLEQAWAEAHPVGMPSMITPFEFIAAELIHSDERFIELFSEECPWLQSCRRPDPVYLYGPRGCGKSTLFRMLSIKTILSIKNPTTMKKTYDETPFWGVYVSCSSELRSRFWLLAEDFLESQESHIVQFFSLLLLEALVESLDVATKFEAKQSELRFGLSEDICFKSVQEILNRIGDSEHCPRLKGVNVFEHCRHRLQILRDSIWKNIIESHTPVQATDAAVISDICRKLREIVPILAQRPIVFLLDDYSHQRIGENLQKRLNQSITFAKHGTPQFMVSSEYLGVNLDDIQEGREVVKINTGAVYIDLKQDTRWEFLEDLLDRRLHICNYTSKIRDLLGMSNMSPGQAMAEAIRKSARPVKGESYQFHYHGLDTISDVCSGDVAMALELVRHIFQNNNTDKTQTTTISSSLQDKAIRGFSQRQIEAIRFSVPFGSDLAAIADRLALLAHKSAVYQNEKKEPIPVVKTHLDIATKAIQELPSPLAELFKALEYRAIIFPLAGSRSREGHEGTERFHIKRILLPRLLAPLARKTPIRIDSVYELRLLLEKPDDFIEKEFQGQEHYLWDTKDEN